MARFEPDAIESTGTIGRFVPDEKPAVKPKKPFIYRDEKGMVRIGENLLDLSDKKQEVNEFGEAVGRQAIIQSPATLAGGQAAAAVSRWTQGMRNFPNPIVRGAGYALPLAAGLGAGIATSIGTNEALVAANPEIEKTLIDDQENQKIASVLGGVVSGAPLYKLGALEKSVAEFAANRVVPATVGAGVQAGVELASTGEVDPASVAAGFVGNAAFNSPTRLGANLMGLSKVKPKTPITDSISSGSGTTKGSVNDALARANEVALGKSEPENLEGFQPTDPVGPLQFEEPVNGRAGEFSPFTNPAEESAALIDARLTEAERRSAPIEQPAIKASETALAEGRIAPQEVLSKFDELIGQQNEKIGKLEEDLAAAKLAQETEAKTRDAKLRVVQGLGEGDLGEFTLPSKMDFEADAPLSIEEQMASQIAFNNRVKKVADDLQSEGIKIDRKTAVELARLAPNPQEFNALRSRIIRASRPEAIDRRAAPIKSLQDLESQVKAPEVPAEKPTYQYTHWSAEETGLNRPITQIDEIVGGKSVRSTTLDKLAAEGIKIPPVPDGLLTGRYTDAEISQFKPKEAPVPQPIQETPVIARNEPSAAIQQDDPLTTAKENERLAEEALARSKKRGEETEARIAELQVEDTYNKAFDRLSEFEMDPEATKGMATRYAKSLEKKGLLTSEEVAEFQRISKDKDMGVEDVVSEIRSTLEIKQSRALKAKKSSSSMGIVPEEDLSVQMVRKAVNAANDKLIKMMAKTSVEASQPEPVYSIFPETVDQVADDFVAKSYQAGNESTPEVQENLVKSIMDAPEPYRAGLTDLSARFPLLFDNVVGKVFSDTIGGMAKFVKSQIGTVRGNIREASPRVAGALSESIRWTGKMRHDLTSRIDPLGDKARKIMTREDFSALNAANLTGDRALAESIFARYGDNQNELLQAYNESQKAFGEIGQMLRDRGLEVPAKDDYFPRILRDRKGLLKSLGSDKSIFEDAVSQRRKAKLRAEENKKGEPLTPEEKQKVIITDEEETEILNQLVAGSFRGGAGKKGYLQQRTIQGITPELSRFYEPFDVAANMYVQKVTRDLANIDFLGRTKDGGKYNEIDGSIGQIIKDEIRSGRLNDEGLEIVINNLNSYLKHTSTYETDLGKAANFFRKLQTYAYLSDVGSAIIQASEIFPIMWRYGAINTLKPGQKFSNKEMGIYEGNQDLIGLRYSNPQANIALKGLGQIEKVYALAVKNFIGRADELMTGVQSKAAFNWINDLVKKPDSKEFKAMDKEYSAMFGPEKWSQILADLQSPEFKSGKLNENTGLFMLTEISQLKPIDSADRAQGYNAGGPWKKLLYSLRTYPIKQIDVLRKNIYENIKKGTLDGWTKAGAAFTSYMLLVATGQQVMNFVRDKFFNRETDPSEYAVTGALQLAMIPRYSVYRAKEASIPDALLDTFIPGLGFTRDVSDDVFLTRDKLMDRKDSKGFKVVKDGEEWFEKARTPQYLPGVGRSLYWHFGKGAESEKKKEQDRLMGKQQESTVEMLGGLIVPNDLKSPRKD